MGNSPNGIGVQNARLSTFYSRETWIEGRAEDQLAQVAGWPGMREIAAFPDLHPGKHGPVGAAFLADRIYPQLVGPDIGCGMALFRIDMQRRKLKIDKGVRRLRVLAQGADEDMSRAALSAAGLDPALSPGGLGTIGGGNHFCEVQAVEDVLSKSEADRLGLERGQLSLLVHSGSRNLGASVFMDLEASWVAGYEADSEAGRAYLALHERAVAWARLNRQMIAEAAAGALRADLELICDSVHNSVAEHDGAWLHRKGAAAPEQGLAPLAGSRESESFLLSAGTIPPEALGSLSHGAGRRYDRASMHGRIPRTRSGLAAMEKTRFGGQVICEDRDLLIEEAGSAYKDAARVLADLEAHRVAHPIVSLTPLITFKTARREACR